MTEKKEVANRVMTEALDWWDDQPSSSTPRPLQKQGDGGSPVSIVWKAPFYRVRLGPFASRAQAEKVLSAAQSSFPEAFVAPERLRSSQ